MTVSHDRWIAHSGEVLYPRPGFVTVTPSDIDEIKRRAAASPRRRCRLCLHDDPAASLHNMVIALARGAYDRPHRHLGKVETLMALEGKATFVRFAPDGTAKDRLRLSTSSDDGSALMVRTPIGEFHTLLIESEFFVFCESTVGPFDAASSEFAPWSPALENQQAVEQYLIELMTRIRTL